MSKCRECSHFDRVTRDSIHGEPYTCRRFRLFVLPGQKACASFTPASKPQKGLF